MRVLKIPYGNRLYARSTGMDKRFGTDTILSSAAVQLTSVPLYNFRPGAVVFHPLLPIIMFPKVVLTSLILGVLSANALSVPLARSPAYKFPNPLSGPDLLDRREPGPDDYDHWLASLRREPAPEPHEPFGKGTPHGGGEFPGMSSSLLELTGITKLRCSPRSETHG